MTKPPEQAPCPHCCGKGWHYAIWRNEAKPKGAITATRYARHTTGATNCTVCDGTGRVAEKKEEA